MTSGTRVDVLRVDWIDVDNQSELQACDPASARSVAFERSAPVRALVAYRGQRHLSGYFWSAKAGRSLLFESRLEMHNLMRLERDPNVASLSTQPFRIAYRSEGRVRQPVPDIFCRLVDGTGRVEECKPSDAQRVPRIANKLALTRRAVESIGLDYHVVGELQPTFAANLLWLAGFRRQMRDPHGIRDHCMDRLANNGPLPLREVVAPTEPAIALPVAFGLLWSGELTADLTAPLSTNSVISIGTHHE